MAVFQNSACSYEFFKYQVVWSAHFPFKLINSWKILKKKNYTNYIYVFMYIPFTVGGMGNDKCYFGKFQEILLRLKTEHSCTLVNISVANEWNKIVCDNICIFKWSKIRKLSLRKSKWIHLFNKFSNDLLILYISG